jgi:hypothetical protein
MSERGFDYSRSVEEFVEKVPTGRKVQIFRYRELPEEQLEAVLSDYSAISVPMLKRILESPNNELRVIDIDVHRKLNSFAKKLNIIDENEDFAPVICVMKQVHYVLYTKSESRDAKAFHFGQAFGSALILDDVAKSDFGQEVQGASG